MEQAVEQIVNVMRDRYGERLYIPDLAAEAFFSPFHFSRIFRRETGVAPGQYLTAVRLFEAKRLLLTTSANVADIACQVGYRGIGTFTTRFTGAVGVSPGQYRRLPWAGMLSIADHECRIPDPQLLPAPRRAAGGTATVVASARRLGARRLFVGVFASGVPQGAPAAWRVVDGLGPAQLTLGGVPAGDMVLIAVAQGCPSTDDDQAVPAIFVSPLHVKAGTVTRVELVLRRPRRTDPPIMISLCDDLSVPQRLAI